MPRSVLFSSSINYAVMEIICRVLFVAPLGVSLKKLQGNFSRKESTVGALECFLPLSGTKHEAIYASFTYAMYQCINRSIHYFSGG